MTRLLTDGAESGDTSRVNSIVTSFDVSSTARTGNYSYSNGNVNGSEHSGVLPLSAAASEFYVRVAFRGNTNVTDYVLRFLDGVSQSGSIRVNGLSNSTTLGGYDGATLRVTSSSIVWNINEWHVVEVYYKHAANPNGRITIKFDGTIVADYTGTTNSQPQTTNIQLIQSGVSGNIHNWDDIAVNDISGSIDNSWVGDGGILMPLVPISTGTYVGFLASGSATTWQSIDEIPANSTDFIYTSVSGTVTTFNTSSLSGLPVGALISRLWVELYAKESAADGDKVATLLRSGVTDVTGTSQSLTLAFARYISSEYITNPDTSGTWSVTAINSVQPGVVAE